MLTFSGAAGRRPLLRLRGGLINVCPQDSPTRGPGPARTRPPGLAPVGKGVRQVQSRCRRLGRGCGGCGGAESLPCPRFRRLRSNDNEQS